MIRLAIRFAVLTCLLVLVGSSILGCLRPRSDWGFIKPSKATDRKVISFGEVYSEDWRLLGYLEHRSTLYEGLKYYVDEYFVYDDHFTMVGYINEKGSAHVYDRVGDLKRIGDYEIQTGALRILGYTGKATFSSGVQ